MKEVVDYVSTECILCVSPTLIAEVNDKLKNKFHAEMEPFHNFFGILTFAELSTPTVKVVFPTDPKDAFLLELAEACEAEYLITGDKKHLLPLQAWKQTKIVTPRKCMDFDLV